MRDYLSLMRKILLEGEQRTDRTGVGSYSLFGEQLNFDLQEGFPAVTTKRLFFRGVQEELAWMLRGETNVKSLQEAGVHIWDEWADKKGELGPVYGRQWRSWFVDDWAGGDYIDQIATLELGLRQKRDSRRLILSAWNVADLDKMALQPCHVMSQFYVRENRYLDCHMYQRSCDFFLGGPFNIAHYALLTHILADRQEGLDAGRLIISYGDVHIYLNHREQCLEQLRRSPRYLPELKRIDPLGDRNIDKWPVKYALSGYDPHPPIKADIAV